MKRFAIGAALVIGLALVTGPNAYAQLLQTEEWDQWNSASTSLYPDERWQQYAAPEHAGWSSEKLEGARRILEVAGSAAVMVIYDGAVLAQWGGPGSFDFDGGGVGINDFLELLAAWGPCP